jgi:hypothetical protein
MARFLLIRVMLFLRNLEPASRGAALDPFRPG